MNIAEAVIARQLVADYLEGLIDKLSIEAVNFLSPEIDALDETELVLMRKLCAVAGHESISDQCGKPEHDYCTFCREITPNGAK